MPDQKEKYVQLDEAIARHRGEPGALMRVTAGKASVICCRAMRIRSPRAVCVVPMTV